MKDEITEIWNGHPETRATIGKARPPFTQDILDKWMPLKFHSPQIRSYYRPADSIDTINHLSAFTDWGVLHGYSNAIMCRAFPRHGMTCWNQGLSGPLKNYPSSSPIVSTGDMWKGRESLYTRLRKFKMSPIEALSEGSTMKCYSWKTSKIP